MRTRRAASTKSSSSSPISIGNCKVEIEGDGVTCQLNDKELLISACNDVNIKILVDDSRVYVRRKTGNRSLSNLGHQDNGGTQFSLEDHSFLLLNPKDEDSQIKSHLQEVLKLYSEELPTMIYAANTGKKSQFLERCISSGKYRTLILKSKPDKRIEEIVAAISYQIVPYDTQYAEIPLAAVKSKYQKMGIGQVLYKELRERLQNVGVQTIVCWADKMAEGFWLKQGFLSVGEVDRKGKVSRLPVKADVRKALSFPGGSMLMLANVKVTRSLVNTSEEINTLSSSKPHSPSFAVTNVMENIDLQQSKTNMRSRSMQNNVGFKSTGVDSGEAECGSTSAKHCSSGEKLKRHIWEASLSSLKSKRVRGSQLISCSEESDKYLSCNNCLLQSCDFKEDIQVLSDEPVNDSCLGTHAGHHKPFDINEEPVLKENWPRIMFMDIANDAKKASLTEIVDDLGGSVTCHGSASTHVITGKARRTLNFSVALCSGAWILSPSWLKECFREGRFLEESHYILEDEEYLLKYKTKLRDAVVRAKANPHSLLRGYHVCFAEHIQPPVNVLSAIIHSAGGKVMKSLDRIVDPSKTIFIACDEDISEALLAAKKGVWSFSSDWLMNCVMRQELDMEAPQFTESL